MDVFTVSGHNLVFASQSALANGLSPIGTFTGSLVGSYIKFFPIVLGICILFFILNLFFGRFFSFLLDRVRGIFNR